MACPRCGASVPPHADRCTACGEVIEPHALTTTVFSDGTTFVAGIPPATWSDDRSTGAGEMVTGAGVEHRGRRDHCGQRRSHQVKDGRRRPAGSRPGFQRPLSHHQAPRARRYGSGLSGLGCGAQRRRRLEGDPARAETGTASSALEKRFKNELLLARQVTHKSVVRIHDLGEIGGIKYITMPYIEGHDLATVLRDGKLPVARTMRLAKQIVSGLEAAHEAGVVHRNLKPANIMISGKGEDLNALIMDFGISASTGEAVSGGVTGTLEYMAPEQAAGGTIDARADIYAFGLILYEMLHGRRPARAGPCWTVLPP